MCDIVKDKLKFVLPQSEINIAHRLGRKTTAQAPDKRPIIVKFCRREGKQKLMEASRRQSSGSRRLFVNESLTPKRRSMLYALRQMKRAHPDIVLGCTSMDGRVFAFTKPRLPGARNMRHLLSTKDDLQAFCRDYVKKSLDTFLSTWTH